MSSAKLLRDILDANADILGNPIEVLRPDDVGLDGRDEPLPDLEALFEMPLEPLAIPSAEALDLHFDIATHDGWVRIRNDSDDPVDFAATGPSKNPNAALRQVGQMTFVDLHSAHAVLIDRPSEISLVMVIQHDRFQFWPLIPTAWGDQLRSWLKPSGDEPLAAHLTPLARSRDPWHQAAAIGSFVRLIRRPRARLKSVFEQLKRGVFDDEISPLWSWTAELTHRQIALLAHRLHDESERLFDALQTLPMHQGFEDAEWLRQLRLFFIRRDDIASVSFLLFKSGHAERVPQDTIQALDTLGQARFGGLQFRGLATDLRLERAYKRDPTLWWVQPAGVA